MRRGMKALSLMFIVLAIILAIPQTSLASSNTEFKIGVYWPPVATQTNATQYDYLQDANINWIINTHATDLSTEAINNTMLDLAGARGMKVIASDSRFKKIYDNVATNAEIDAMADSYKNHSALGGYYVMDEPFTLISLISPTRTTGFYSNVPTPLIIQICFPLIRPM
ncbi:hypothetical protein [Cohnella silvisoli]|uniref:Uncharacterized protein n=1 Tax=Cohnella silvisoli TaxID=2873699 RepID=A0ABV1KRN9_9BACL|nr:hypothetical protein [Cohnella silvisoli]MCD9022471.1 hypothetical protein [Cohnella silvisoli]